MESERSMELDESGYYGYGYDYDLLEERYCSD